MTEGKGNLLLCLVFNAIQLVQWMKLFFAIESETRTEQKTLPDQFGMFSKSAYGMIFMKVVKILAWMEDSFSGRFDIRMALPI